MRRRYKYFSAYGITKEESKELMRLATLPENEPLVRLSANEAREELAEFLYLSMTKNLSYEKVDQIIYVPVKGDDFYGHRRYAFYLLKLFLKCREVLRGADGKPDTEEIQTKPE